MQLNQKNILSLHSPKSPLILHNIWDSGSAKAINNNDTKVIATSSWAVAASRGVEDGEKLPFEEAIVNLTRIVNSIDKPVSFDFESGYAQDPQAIVKNFAHVINAGASGINFEDQIINSDGKRYSIQEQSTRIKAIADYIQQNNFICFINARTDIFLQKSNDEYNADDVKEAIERCDAYAKAGANGFFIPGLLKIDYIKQICAASPIPVNIMVDTFEKMKEIADLGIVSRFSYGPALYIKNMQNLKDFVE